jgi:hypothetical protein
MYSAPLPTPMREQSERKPTSCTKKKDMPKRKRDDKAAGRKVAAVLYERWDTDALAHINELCLDFQTEAVVKKVAIAMRHPDANMHRAVSYTAREFAEGRVYGQGLQGCSGWIRRICTNKFYHHIGVVNCGPVLLCQILEKKTGTCPALITDYAYKRERVYSIGSGRKSQS